MKQRLNLILASLLIVLLTLSFATNYAFAESKAFRVGAGERYTLQIYLGEGDRIEFSISASGGSGNDVNLTVKDPYDVILLQGLVSREYDSQFTASDSGSYEFEFDNSFSIISSKSVDLSYEIYKKPVSSFDGGAGWLIIIIVIIVIIASSVGIGLSMKSRRAQSKQNATNLIDEKPPISEKTKIEKEQDERALDTLKTRLAKGEISKEEFDKLRKEFE